MRLPNLYNYKYMIYIFGNSIYRNTKVRFHHDTSNMSDSHLNFQQAVLGLAAHASADQTSIPPSHQRILSWIADVDANREFLDPNVPPIPSPFEYPDSLLELFSDNKSESNFSFEFENLLSDLNNKPSSDPNHLPYVYWDEPELMTRFGDDIEVEHCILLLQFLSKSRFFTPNHQQQMLAEASINLEKRLEQLGAYCIINF